MFFTGAANVNFQPLFVQTRGTEESDLDMTSTYAHAPIRTVRPSTISYDVPSSTILEGHSASNMYPNTSPDPMTVITSRPTSLALPDQTLPSMDEAAASQVYLQAMNCTPTNFFEGFSSETAMMDYFSWQQDAGPSQNGFAFQ